MSAHAGATSTAVSSAVVALSAAHVGASLAAVTVIETVAAVESRLPSFAA